MHSLRSACCLCFVLATANGWLASAAAQNDLSSEPYVVYVSQEEAYTRCGPAGDYYRTDPLRHGQALEVYAETDDGWLGIRPTDDSFCWVIAEAVELGGDQEHGTVVEDKTVAWIGTHLGRARKYRWQVQLANGEEVSVIGRSEREGPDGPQLWYRVVPPSGEFRWVHRNQVVMTSEELVASIERDTGSSRREFLPASRTNVRGLSETGRTNVQDFAGSSRAAELASSEDRATSPSQRASSRRNSPSPDAPSVLVRDPAPIGSGLKEEWKENGSRKANGDTAANTSPRTFQEAVKQGGLLASIEFLGRPRLTEIGAGSTAPSASETAGDENWVTGVARADASAIPLAAAGAAGRTNMQGLQESGNMVRQVAVLEPIAAGATGGGNSSPANIISPEQIARIEAELQGADVDRLSLVLSRLMAGRAGAAEVQPVVRAAQSLAQATVDQVTAGRARLLAERAEQYQRVASRRGGGSVVQAGGTTTIPPVQPVSAIQDPQSSVSQEGFLVQVYSVRANSPPFALTDHSGRTLVYVTPAPGVNIRMHLNSYIRVNGQQGFLRGLNTPHILVRQASRATQ